MLPAVLARCHRDSDIRSHPLLRAEHCPAREKEVGRLVVHFYVPGDPVAPVAANPRRIFSHTPRLTVFKNLKRRGSADHALGGLSANLKAAGKRASRKLAGLVPASRLVEHDWANSNRICLIA